METSLSFYPVENMPASRLLWELLSSPLGVLTDLARVNGDIAHERVATSYSSI